MPSGPSNTIIVTIANADVPVRLSTRHLFVNQAIVMGHKALRTDNDNDVYIGPTQVNGEQAGVLVPGGSWALDKVDLWDWFVDGTAGDGVVIVHW